VLPALSAEFGIKPADIEDMTPREINEYLEYLTELRKAEREAARGRK
jgi:hypothetical protein